VRSRFLVLAASAILLEVAALLMGCGSSSEEARPLANGGQSVSTAEAVHQALPTVNPQVGLVAYHSPDKGYSLAYPEGWEVVAEGGFTDYFVWRAESGRTYAQLAVSCRTAEQGGTSPDRMASQDVQMIKEFGGGAVNPTDVGPIQVGDLPGKQFTYTYQLSGLTVEQVAAYVVHGACGWRLALASYGPGTLGPYLPLFQRIIAAFRPD